MIGCDLYGAGPCMGQLYHFRGGSSVRCARHVKLQDFWADLPMYVVEDFVTWEAQLDPAQEGMILRGRVIDRTQWDE